MNAKSLIRKMNEADDLPPGIGGDMAVGSPGGPPRRSPRRPPMNPNDPEGMMGDVGRVMGREPAGPKGQFSPKELSQVKDCLILILAGQAGSDYDKDIGMALMSGKELDPGQLRHIVDEAQHIQVPEAHSALLQKIATMCPG